MCEVGQRVNSLLTGSDVHAHGLVSVGLDFAISKFILELDKCHLDLSAGRGILTLVNIFNQLLLEVNF